MPLDFQLYERRGTPRSGDFMAFKGLRCFNGRTQGGFGDGDKPQRRVIRDGCWQEYSLAGRLD